MIQIQLMSWCSLVTVTTDIDIGSYRELDEALASCDSVLPICLDVSTCPFMDSSGLGVILRTRKIRNEQFWIVAPAKCQVKRLADAAGVSSFLHLAESIDDVQRIIDTEQKLA